MNSVLWWAKTLVPKTNVFTLTDALVFCLLSSSMGNGLCTYLPPHPTWGSTPVLRATADAQLTRVWVGTEPPASIPTPTQTLTSSAAVAEKVGKDHTCKHRTLFGLLYYCCHNVIHLCTWQWTQLLLSCDTIHLLCVYLIGTLCGECRNGTSVTALFNQCSDCKEGSVLLIPALSKYKRSASGRI